jgi:hypothetical protein
MNGVAKDMTGDDLRKFLEYFAKLRPPKPRAMPPILRSPHAPKRSSRKTIEDPATIGVSRAASRCLGLPRNAKTNS